MQIECPNCGKTLSAPDDKAGQIVKCPECGGEMQLPTTGAPQGSEAAGAPSGAAGDQGKATKACRYCGETILAVAQKCKHCGTYLTGPMAGKSSSGPGAGAAPGTPRRVRRR